MKKIKILLLSIIGGSGVVVKTCLPEQKAIINAERSAVISAERSTVKNINKEIKTYRELYSKLEKIKDLIDIVRFDDLRELFNEHNFNKITNNEVLKNENIPILRKLLQTLLRSKINFTNTQIKEIITEDSRSKYHISEHNLSNLKIIFSKTYADYYYSIFLDKNSCNKNLLTILTEYRKERGLEESGPLNKQLRKCEGQAN